MTKFKKLAPKDLPTVMVRFTAWLMNEPTETQRLWCQSLNELFDEAMNQDAFGTEGQCDPRGDHRD